MLSLFGFGKRAVSPQLKLKLPQLNSFVDLVIAGGGPRGSVCVESLSDRDVTVTSLPGTTIGATGIFSYSNDVGRFRFSSRCAAVRADEAVFAIPERIETLQVFSGAQKRVAVRLDATVPAQWRFALGMTGSGEYTRGSLTDISRSGASLIVDREVKLGSYVEVRFAVSTAATPLVLVAEVMRNSPIETSKRVSLGLRFHGVKPEEDRAITEFITKRQADRRNRGLA
ncbi:MAG TPA: PilZ domain-containing protein [Candidatus Elarobacter sp.]|jgi:hypothetical protein|nr:PilZ domain-containing protein [Candidatus Elarobacter sp.]